MDISTKPILIEPGVRSFLCETLKQCHKFKEEYYNTLFNIGMFIAFLVILAILLVYKYKGKLTEEEKYQKDLEKQEYVMEKIKNYKLNKLKAHQQLITGLPQWENEYS
jgi:ABC-type bacteriocin/lantibiotic exporter with double-glycine peptidase domain